MKLAEYQDLYYVKKVGQEFQPGHDLVVVVRSRAIGAPYGKLEEAYLALAAQLGLLREDV